MYIRNSRPRFKLINRTDDAITASWSPFWEQMGALPEQLLGSIEQEMVRRVVEIEQLQVKALAYDTTNFYTHIASRNEKPQLPICCL